MHLLIPFASALSERGTQALRALKLPHLTQLLARLSPTRRFGSDEFSLSTPQELALAHALGWKGDDGIQPWAAHNAAKDGVAVGTQAWGQLTPVHWHVGNDHVTLTDPQSLHLSAQESHTLFEAVKPLFESEGWAMAWGAPMRWYAAHDSLDRLPCASLDRVIGRNINLWLPATPQARQIRRLQNEVQMLLYQQPINDHRVGLGALPVNSFWLSGCGRAQPTPQPEGLVYASGLRAAVLSSNWSAWAEAWQAIDGKEVRQALQQLQEGKPVTLTLCGDRFAQSFEAQPQGLWSRVGKRLAPPQIAPVLEVL
ncbi:MAG TPA: hypothetical protein VHQ87_01325 [Rhizobacter sp.]|nr:hypothetical protein [Rhizobacter sp.]